MVEGTGPDARGSGKIAAPLMNLGAALGKIVMAERERWPLWVPVLLGIDRLMHAATGRRA